MTPLRILVVSDLSPVAVGSGGERVLWEQASRLARRGHRVRVLSRWPEGDAADAVERQGVRIRHYAVDRTGPLRFLWSAIRGAHRAAAEALAAEPADVLHLHQPLAGYGALRAAAGRPIPCLYTFHSPAPREYRSRRGMTRFHRRGWSGRAAAAVLWAIERACLRRAARIHVLSDFSAEQLRALYRIPAERILKIPGGADTERFRPHADRTAARAALELPAGRPLLFTVRNLEARMGLDVLVRAMPILRRQCPEVLLLIGGSGSLRGELQALSASLHLDDHVRFLGFIPDADLPGYYQAADLFVLPTRELEGFGLVTVEALACGTPVLGTAVGATPEILRPLDPGLLFRGTTPDAMAEDLARFIATRRADTPAGRELRAGCRRHAEAHYAWEVSVSRLEDALRRLIAGTPSSSAERGGTP